MIRCSGIRNLPHGGNERQRSKRIKDTRMKIDGVMVCWCLKPKGKHTHIFRKRLTMVMGLRLLDTFLKKNSIYFSIMLD